MDLGEKIKKRLIIIFVRIPLIIIFIGALISIPLYFLNIVYRIGNTYVEEKGREPESITAADAPYFKNGKRRQRHWKNHTYEYGVDARVGDIIDPGGNLLSGKNSMVIIGISNPNNLKGRRQYTWFPLKLMGTHQDR